MTGYYPTLTAAAASEHLRDLHREAAISRMIADLPDRDRPQTPRQRPAWWSRLTARVAHRTVPAGA